MALHFSYQFTFEDGYTRTVSVDLDEQTLLQVSAPAENLPHWTRLDFHRCSNCPFDPGETQDCPLAVTLITPVAVFAGRESHNQVSVNVSQSQREVSATVSAQRALSSLLGLLMATSGCPHLRFFRPMARHHLPFADAAETVYRAMSMYLLGQYMRRRVGLEADFELEGLRDIYTRVRQVNLGMSERMRDADTVDSPVNAVVLLDLFAQAVPYSVDDALEEFSELFANYLEPETEFGSGEYPRPNL